MSQKSRRHNMSTFSLYVCVCFSRERLMLERYFVLKMWVFRHSRSLSIPLSYRRAFTALHIIKSSLCCNDRAALLFLLSWSEIRNEGLYLLSFRFACTFLSIWLRNLICVFLHVNLFIRKCLMVKTLAKLDSSNE